MDVVTFDDQIAHSRDADVDAEIDAVCERYARFAREEAPRRSPLYARWAQRVVEGRDAAAVLARIAPAHRQPALVFAVTRMLGCGQVPAEQWAAWLTAHADEVVAECMRRSVQTNEPLRCAALVPALSVIDGPIALLEVGASAGLCLYPDRYSYRYEHDGGVCALDPDDGVSPVVLHAQWRGPLADLRLPEVVWRAGIDLQPRDARDAADRAWLEGLVWPGEQGRAARVRAALEVAAAAPPHLIAADAADALADVAADVLARVPAEATLVVTTPGVLVHVPQAARERIVAAAGTVGRWITMDAVGLHSAVRGQWHPPPDAAAWPNGAFALAVDGTVVAAVDPLGAIVRPIGAGMEWRDRKASARR